MKVFIIFLTLAGKKKQAHLQGTPAMFAAFERPKSLIFLEYASQLYLCDGHRRTHAPCQSIAAPVQAIVYRMLSWLAIESPMRVGPNYA